MNESNLTPRSYGLINRVGFVSLCRKEILRFTNVYTQTLIAPIMTTLLFLAVFNLALGNAVRQVEGINFTLFIAPGLIIMAMAQNAFANTSSSLVIAKVQGNIVDILLPPLSPLELVSAFIVGGTARGIVVGSCTTFGMAFFVPLLPHNILFVFAFGILGSMMLSLLGILGGIWSKKFDHIAAVTNFIIVPFTFLSGTFYSVKKLPEFFYNLTQFNPFFYMIDGFRYGFIGQADSNVWIGLSVLIGTNMILFSLAYTLIAKGFRLKT